MKLTANCRIYRSKDISRLDLLHRWLFITVPCWNSLSSWKHLFFHKCLKTVCLHSCLKSYTFCHGSDWNTWFPSFEWVSKYFWKNSVCCLCPDVTWKLVFDSHLDWGLSFLDSFAQDGCRVVWPVEKNFVVLVLWPHLMGWKMSALAKNATCCPEVFKYPFPSDIIKIWQTLFWSTAPLAPLHQKISEQTQWTVLLFYSHSQSIRKVTLMLTFLISAGWYEQS